MRVVFMGAGDLACPSLEALLDKGRDEVAAVITQPDRPKGRGRNVQPCSAKAVAQRYHIRIHTPENVNQPEEILRIREIAPELIIVVAYGQILGPEILAIPPGGCINIHASLLPVYRGAAPIQWAIAKGEEETGVTSMFMNEKMDAGDIIFQDRERIEESDTAGTLHDRLAQRGAGLLLKTLDAIREDRCPRLPQDPAKVSFAPKLSKEDARIDWTLSARDLYNRVRAFNPWPVCWCRVPLVTERGAAGEEDASERLRVLRVEMKTGSGMPGEVLDTAEGPVAATGGHGAVLLAEVQPEGGKVMAGSAYLQGRSLRPGTVLR